MTLDELIARLKQLRSKYNGRTKAVVGNDFEIKEIESVEFDTPELGATVPLIIIEPKPFE